MVVAWIFMNNVGKLKLFSKPRILTFLKYFARPNRGPSEAKFMADQSFQRSPHLMNVNDSAIIVVDMQERLLPHIQGHDQISKNVIRLLDAAEVLSVSVVATEQYPKGLGPTAEPIRSKIFAINGDQSTELPAKTMFSCRECATPFRNLLDSGVRKLLLCGIETHVCIAQTALDMVAAGFDVLIAVDAVGSRFPLDHEIALKRLEANGCQLTTTEAAMFELCEKAGSDQFKTISKMLQPKP
jgi:nicotinamidase-related amidase